MLNNWIFFFFSFLVRIDIILNFVTRLRCTSNWMKSFKLITCTRSAVCRSYNYELNAYTRHIALYFWQKSCIIRIDSNKYNRMIWNVLKFKSQMSYTNHVDMYMTHIMCTCTIFDTYTPWMAFCANSASLKIILTEHQFPRSAPRLSYYWVPVTVFLLVLS